MNQYSFTPKAIHCAMCGVEIIAEHNRKKFCTECAKQRELEGQRRYRELMRKKRQAEKAVGVIDRELHYCDSLKNVRKCLNCTKPECNNCLCQRKSHYVVPDEIRKKVTPLIKNGMPQKDIAKHCGVSEPTVSRWVAGLRWEGAI